MKSNIHPTYHPQAKVTCASCGNSFTVGSTQSEIRTEICSNCHPFYTGKQVLIDTAGRVERFQKIVKKSAERKAGMKDRASRKAGQEKAALKAGRSEDNTAKLKKLKASLDNK